MRNKNRIPFGQTGRHEALNKNEQAIYKMIDTLQQMPIFKKYYNTVYFLTTGYKSIGNYEIGPWYNWISTNAWEGVRLRFDLGTTPGFHKKLYLHGYAAYGFGDQKLKGKFEAFYLPQKHPRTYFYAGILHDLDNGQNYYDEVSLDNIFTFAIRKKGVPVKFLQVDMQQLEFYKSTYNGFSVTVNALRKIYEPLKNLPGKENFKPGAGNALNNFETSVKFRFAYLEKFLEGNYYRVSLGSDFPIAEAKISKGFSGVLNSNYNYWKMQASISDNIKVAPYGTIYVNAYGGKIFGTLPYLLLEAHPGNEIYYYNKYAFNLMNRFEYISDKYAGINIEHNIGNGLFKYIGLTRRLKFRQFYTAKFLWGSLSNANKALNFVQDHPFKSLDGSMYSEVGTGVDNILKVLRIDALWRLSPRPLPKGVNKFGVFVSFRLTF